MLKKVYLVDDVPGSLSNIYEIKILICNILSETKTNISKEQLNLALQINETVNYFNFCQAMKELFNSNHIIENENKNGKIILNLTKIGEETAKIFKNKISKKLIEKILKTLEEILKEEHENKNKKIRIKSKNDGYIVKLTLEEIKSNLMDVELFCPNLKTAEHVKNQMKLKTTEIYKSILAIVNDDYETISKLALKLKDKKNKKWHPNFNILVFKCQFKNI